MKKKDYLVCLICILFSYIVGFFSDSFLMGGTALATSLLCSYMGSIGHRSNYLWRICYNLIYSYVSFKNHLYGLCFICLLIFTPLNVHGYLSWGKNMDDEQNVKMRRFDLKMALIITSSCIVGSFLLSFLLSLIPTQELAFLDASANIINLCALILFNLRYFEAWWLWIFNNIIELLIWFIVFINGGNQGFIMLLVALGYFCFNIYGIIVWNKNSVVEK